jgi:hypothetical protein
MTASSMTTPNAMYFHSTTSSLRARATMVVFLPRPSAILLLSQSDSADCGWFCSHSQASSISADLRRGFSALGRQRCDEPDFVAQLQRDENAATLVWMAAGTSERSDVFGIFLS